LPGPGIRRRKLAATLKQLREQAGKKPADAAEWLSRSQSTISKIEGGKQAVDIAQVRSLLQLYGVESPESDAIVRLASEASERGWWAAYSDTVPDWFADYIALETDAVQVQTWDSSLIHGLGQTADVTTALVASGRQGVTEPLLERTTSLRQARQSRLTGDNPVELHMILGEGAVRQVIGGPDVWRGQLSHLLDMSDMDNVTIQVLPFSAGAHPGLVSPFTLLRFGEDYRDMDAAYTEVDRGCLWMERPADLEHYAWVFGELSGNEDRKGHALDEAGTRDLLSSLMRHL